MPRKTDGEKIDELQTLVASITERLDQTIKSLEALYQRHKETASAAADLRREYEREMALLRREVEDLKRWKDDQKREREERSRRLWSFGPNVAGAVINVLLAALVAF